MTNEHKTCTVVVMVSVILLGWWQDLWTNIHNKIGLKRNGHSNLTLEKDGFFEKSDVQPESEGNFVAQTLWWTETLCFLSYNPASSGPLICIQKKKKKTAHQYEHKPQLQKKKPVMCLKSLQSLMPLLLPSVEVQCNFMALHCALPRSRTTLQQISTAMLVAYHEAKPQRKEKFAYS